ncbi:MAG: DinB family protein [Thermoanaerobaculia bacterium]
MDEGRDLLSGLAREAYVAEPPISLGTVGGHVRHCLDFYRCFLRGLGDGRVDYDARGRDRAVEESPELALVVLEEVCDELERISPEVEDRRLEAVRGTLGAGATDASTVGRELQFLASHTVHHFALIGALLRVQGVDPGPDFGVAPSTLEHRRQLAVR